MAWTKTDTFKIFHETDKKGEKHPDWKGSVDLDGALIQAIVTQYKEGGEGKTKLKIAFWDAVESSKGTGVRYFNANISVLTGDTPSTDATPQVTDENEIEEISF